MITNNKKEVLKKIESLRGCYACVYSCDEQGYNGMYNSTPVDDLLDEEIEGQYNMYCLQDDDWVLDSFTPITNEDIDIEIWAQEFDEETINRIKSQIDEGLYHMAVFSSDYYGTQKILVWDE